MSVINNAGKGDSLIILEAFEGPPDGVRPSPDTVRRFRIGEHVRYLGFHRHPVLRDNPICWMVNFEAADGRLYTATQTYFVTEEAWLDLKKFFSRRRKTVKVSDKRSANLNGKQDNHR